MGKDSEEGTCVDTKIKVVESQISRVAEMSIAPVLFDIDFSLCCG